VFERIVLRQSEQGAPISFGEIAEALVFYRRVHVVLERGTILELLKKIGPSNFFRLIELERVSVVYIEEHLGTLSQRVGLADNYNFVAISLAGKEPRRISRKERLTGVFALLGYDNRQAGRYAERLLKTAKVRSMSGDDFVPGGVVKAAKEDLKDQLFIRQAVSRAVGRVVPEQFDMPHFSFEILDFGRHFQVATDIDLKRINSLRSDSVADSDVTVASLLSSILTARADLAVASYYGGDFRTSRVSSEILRVKHEDLLRRSGINSSEISEFKEVVLTELPGVAEVLDSGERRAEDFFDLLAASSKFASWTSGLSPDEKLVGEYFRAAASSGWLGSLPIKSTRIVIGTAVGVLNPIAGIIASLADSFVVDKLFGGWRPSHFVDRKLKPFLEP
jgi:hypothetical protein